MNVNDWLTRQFPSPPCWELVAAVYLEELGQGVSEFKTVDKSVRSIASAFRLVLSKGGHGFSRVQPVDYAVVLLGKSPGLGLHHCGILYGGKLLHAMQSGNYYDDMSAILDEYPLVEYWAK